MKKPKGVKESVSLESIKAYIKRFPVPTRVRKLADRFTRGLPDLQAFWCQGGLLVVLEVEVKRPRGGKVSHLQRAEEQKMLMATAGHVHGVYIYVVARSVQEVQDALFDRGVGYATNDLRPLPS